MDWSSVNGRMRQNAYFNVNIHSRCVALHCIAHCATIRTICRAIIFKCQVLELSNNSFWRVLFQSRGCILVLISSSSTHSLSCSSFGGFYVITTGVCFFGANTTPQISFKDKFGLAKLKL